jgi:PiT family inorganic phosphate transporter
VTAVDPGLGGILILTTVIVLALTFDYINGFHDAANAIATVVSTRVLSPRIAVIFGALFNFIGAMAGTKVAETVGKGFVDTQMVTLDTVLAGVMAAIVWNLITWYKGLPTSSSHALIGSLLGATFSSALLRAAANGHGIHWDKLTEKVLIPMVVSPLTGFTLGMLLMGLLTWGVYRIALPRINATFGKFQLLSAGWMAYSHGQNDAQKSMGIIALALMTFFPSPDGHFTVPLWVIVSCALAMGLGTLSGGWKIIRTLGSKMIKLQPIHGFAAETTAALIISTASHWGIPLSTTHVISSSIMGVGSTKRWSAVKWGVVGNILGAWIMTIPFTFMLAAILFAGIFGLRALHQN